MKYNIDFFFRVTHEKPCCFSSHTHECYELVYYTCGKGLVAYKDEMLEYNAGDIIIVEPNTPHDETNNYKSINTVLGFYPNEETVIPTGKFSATPAMIAMLDNMLDETAKQLPLHREVIDKQFDLLLLCLSRPKINDNQKNFSTIFTNIDNYVEENLCSPISLESFAKTYNYSTSHFRHMFTKEMNMSPKKYIMQKRMNKAQKLLTETQKNITEIAHECGFYDTAQFSRLFKKKFGVTPSERRKYTN